jgi:hypothetical protein
VFERGETHARQLTDAFLKKSRLLKRTMAQVSPRRVCCREHAGSTFLAPVVTNSVSAQRRHGDASGPSTSVSLLGGFIGAEATPPSTPL